MQLHKAELYLSAKVILASAYQFAKQIRNPYSIVATTNEAQNEFSDLTRQNINSLQRLGVRVFQKTDATKIHNDFAGQTFNNVIFQFPHTGSREPIEGRNPNFVLLRDFLKSAKPLLSYGGKVIVSIVDSPYYQGAFQIEEAGTKAKYKHYTIYKFNPLLFANYIHTMTNEGESAISKNDDLVTIVFE
jgi:25S rRNA (uracil2634-N3)-methyltransferase